ncbi:murein L,D-transpeptidase catalytic domain family protein [Bdellovibrio sp. NC01]|uniref:murein L,D-transpeptidase catalytic domain family protein n=1 Tax=Bdellovibrio sp. NC01 TaxID=2220073 RepID=UPI00115980FB|nr:murein L,D-transpeptidase catalytic domain family protein [Bdellovibrio sp. NC01]QDK37628.1 hypothetical protein DOE51_08555 [Bdellovibrio sp. NC01]
MKPLYGLAALAFIAQPVYAGSSFYTRKSKGVLLYDLYRKAGVPTPALQRTFEFLDLNSEKEFKVRADERLVTKEITNKNYAVIIDFTKPSSSRRLYLLNLNTGAVEKFYVAHGVNTGDDDAEKFSNIPDSRKSSLGLYLTGGSYVGKHGESLYLYGLEKSNDRAFERAIVMHGATYVSMDFLDKYGRMGRSWGCPAVSQQIIKKLIPLLKDGAVVYAYHKDLMPVAVTSPTVQNVGNNKGSTTDNSNNVMPEEIEP